jgi:hypothetical protein
MHAEASSLIYESRFSSPVSEDHPEAGLLPISRLLARSNFWLVRHPDKVQSI